MKKALLPATAVALAFLAGSALAADLPSMKGPPPAYMPPPMMTWTGFYVGVNAGYTWAESSTANFAYSDTGAGGYGASALAGNYPGSLGFSNSGGFIGGGQIGYNWQFANAFVAGLEADIQGITSNQSYATFSSPGLNGFVPASTTASRSLDYLGTVRGRIGYLFTPTLLVYATGGLAYGQTNLSHNTFFAVTPFAQGTAFSDTRVGWTVGGGLEWMFHPNWSAKVEYLYYDLGTVSSAPLVYTYGANISTAQASTRFDGHVVRAGLNYHFHWGSAPILAKY